MASIAERFSQFVLLSEDCWIWTGGMDKDGYGVFGLSTDIKSVRAHRFSWEMVNGPVPDGIQVLHSCDNPSCVRPAHLWLGTHLDNHRDKAKKNRANKGKKRDREDVIRGEEHPNAILDEAAIEDIRKNYIPRKVPLIYFAKKYNVCTSTVHCVVSGGSWKEVHLGG